MLNPYKIKNLFKNLIKNISAINRNYVKKKCPMYLENLYKYFASV